MAKVMAGVGVVPSFLQKHEALAVCLTVAISQPINKRKEQPYYMQHPINTNSSGWGGHWCMRFCG